MIATSCIKLIILLERIIKQIDGGKV
jgi:hypothetical protein